MKHTTPSQYAKVRVIATVQDIDDGKYFIEVEYPVVGGELRRCLLPRSIMHSPSKAFEKLLDQGADLPIVRGSAAMLARNVLNKVPARSYQITSRTGWHGKSFVLIDMTLGRDADTLMHRSRISSSPGDPQVKGSHKEWRSALREPCLASSYLTFGIALAFAGPLLELVGRGEGASYYLVGESSTGKTLSELAGQSVIGPAVRSSLITHDMTDRAFEEIATAHNHLLLVIDEVARTADSKHLRLLAHKLAGGGGRRRSSKAKQDPTLADLNWVLLSLWSGETSLGILSEGRQRGEIVRLTEIPVPTRKRGGSFDRIADSKKSAAQLARETEVAVKENFGFPIRAFVAVLEPNRASYSTQARDLVERFVTKVGGGTDPWSRRFANNFGLVYAAARLAAEMNIAPWPRDHAFKCVSRLYRRARALVATPEEARDDLLRRLATNASSKRRFPTVKRGRGLPRRVANSAWGIRHHCGGHACLAVLSDRLNNLVRPQRHADQVRRLLASGGFTLPGKDDRNVRQIKLDGFGPEKPYFVCVRVDRLPNVKK